jgi:hypothetical protein
MHDQTKGKTLQALQLGHCFVCRIIIRNDHQLRRTRLRSKGADASHSRCRTVHRGKNGGDYRHGMWKREEELTATSFAEATEGQEGAKVAKGRGD